MEDLLKIIQDAQKEIVGNFPISMQCRFFLNSGITEEDTPAALKFIKDNMKPYDFNLINEDDTIPGILFNISGASILNTAWRKETCIDCNEEFYLTYGETKFYQNKNYVLPKRCKCCRDKRKSKITA